MRHQYRAGLVLHLATEELIRLSPNCIDNKAIAVKGNHFFVCVEADAQGGTWEPLYSDPRPGRRVIPSDEKNGHQKWLAGNSYYNPLQLWQPSHKAIQLAARKKKEKSSGNAPNTVIASAVPKRREFLDFHS